MAEQTNHYFLVGARISYLANGKEDSQPKAVYQNAVVVGDSPKVPVKLMGKAQQAVQLNFLKGQGEDAQNYKVTDIYIQSITHLGEFTSEEFHEQPENKQ